MVEPSPTSTKAADEKKKRIICGRCKYPKEKACICCALPETPLYTLFKRCRMIVLQHPHELRRKNRSLPLVELALFGERISNDTVEQEDAKATKDEDFVMKTIVGRRIGDKSDEGILKILRDPTEVVLLVFPHSDAMDIHDGIALAESKIKDNNVKADGESPKADKKINLIFIDASWKHAIEMNNKTEAAGIWPKNMIRVQLTPSSQQDTTQDSSSDNAFIQRRFQIRAPPSPDHLSTAECLAWIASRVENNPEIYEGIMKVLDYMVELWRGFANVAAQGDTVGDKRNRAGRSFSDGDGCREMSQKRRKIPSNKT